VKSITREKRIEVACQYILGNSYREIEELTGVSHGSIVNIVKELQEGRLCVEGLAAEQVEDLRQLAAELKSIGLKPSQSMNGIKFYERIMGLGITPEDIEVWAQLVSETRQLDSITTRELIDSAQRLLELEQSQGKTLEAVMEEYARCQGEMGHLEDEISSLKGVNSQLSEAKEKLSAESAALKEKNDTIMNQIKSQTARRQEMATCLAELGNEKKRLEKEIRKLEKKSEKLSAGIEGRDEILQELDELGFSREDFLQLKSFIKRNGYDKEDFLSALNTYKDIRGIRDAYDEGLKRIKGLNEQKTTLTASITQLGEEKARLQGEIDDEVIAAVDKIRRAGEESAAQLQQEIASLKSQIANLLSEVMNAGEAVGQMRAQVKDGRIAKTELRNFVTDIEKGFGNQ